MCFMPKGRILLDIPHICALQVSGRVSKIEKCCTKVENAKQSILEGNSY